MSFVILPTRKGDVAVNTRNILTIENYEDHTRIYMGPAHYIPVILAFSEVVNGIKESEVNGSR